MQDQQLVTVKEAAAQLRVTAATIRRWIRQGSLVAVQVGGSRAGYRIPSSEVRRVSTPTR